MPKFTFMGWKSVTLSLLIYSARAPVAVSWGKSTGGRPRRRRDSSSAASGLLVGVETAARVLGLESVDFPRETAIGALAEYVSGGSVGDFQPMNINFGIITPLGYRVKGKRNKNAEISARSLEIIDRLKAKEVFSY